MCVFHGDGESCGYCEAPLQLEAEYAGGLPDGGTALNPVLSAPSISHISGILSGNYWSSNEISFGFTTSKSQYDNSDAPNGEKGSFKELSNGGKEIFRDAISQWDEVSGLSIVESGSPSSAEIRIAGSNAPTTAWAYYPSEGWAGGGDIWNNTNYIPAYVASVGDLSGAVGTYAYTTAMHEVGHALGMEHPHDGTNLPASYDSVEYTVMSYKSYVGHSGGGYTNEAHGYAQSLMMLDIAAIQATYGADYSTRSGNTTYSFDPNTGEMRVDGVSYATPAENRVFRTLWDGDGFDTLDFASYSTNLSVNLNPGEGTDLDVGGLSQRSRLGYSSGEWVYASAHIYMSLLFDDDTRSVIEAVVCGSGDDIVIGNAADNLLCGGLGTDTYTLGAGADIVRGTIDELVGDIIVDFDADDIVDVTDLSGSQSIEVGNDGVIRLVGEGDPEDPAEPEDPEDPVEPDLGDARIVRLTEIRDQYETATVEDMVVLGLDDNDSVKTGEGNDRLLGQGGNDTLKSNGGNDTIEGGDGRDKIDSGEGDDLIIAGSGRDSARSRGGNDTIFGGADADSLRSDEGDDAVSGGEGNDRIDAGEGNDLVYGGEGDDHLVGKDGDDLFYGGAGSDVLNGGRGSDTYVFHTADSGIDVIKKFEIGLDLIRIEGFSGGFGDLSFSQGRKSTDIDLGNGSSIQLVRVKLADLTADSFEFHTGTATDRDIQSVALSEIVDTGPESMEMTDGDDKLRLALRTGIEIDLLDGNDDLSSGRGDDTIWGGLGDDSIKGGSGDDLIIAGSGSDDMSGGGGSDVFEFRASDLTAGETDFDVIRDFRSKYDRIKLVGFDDNSFEDLELSFTKGKAQIVVDDVQTISFRNMRDHDDLIENNVIDFL
ncbi:M10 family metallopeptidase C-terminal domain-containing protein [Amaricoccus macauensis]|uniref:M10 family metallopeptidase C-terminal domain-containing protein n=1 Tax=Amaricoccus macauensis TaxID=57001 RepID=UPI003C7B887F